MRKPSPRAEALAASFLTATEWNRSALVAAAAATFGVPRKTAWVRRAAKLALRAFAEPPRAWFRELAIALEEDLTGREGAHPHEYPVPPLTMGRARWDVPELPTTGDLARFLDLTPAEAMWFADPRGLERRLDGDEALRHYRYRWVEKAAGGVRLIEAPKPRMRFLLRRVLHGVLDRVSPHEAAHGFRRGRSARTHAEQHASAAIVVRVDLADFFLSIAAARIRAVFAAMGYPSEVAWLLTALTTNIAPVAPRGFVPGASAASIRSVRRTEMLARTRHLPQGAPTSPALANLVAYGLDVRLAAAASAMSARYSRYADDLVFSGDGTFARRAASFVELVAKIVRDEGFVVNRSKTRLMRHGNRQVVTGIVVNERPTIARAEAKRLEAILYNCVRHGPATQNRAGVPDFRAHLAGHVAHVRGIDPKRATHLQELFARITWE